MSGPAPQGSGPKPAVDAEKLADKVYRLMQADVRLSKARGERLKPPGKGA